MPDTRDLPNPRQRYEQWSSTTPIVTRGLILLILFLSLLNTLTFSRLSLAINCVPLFTILHGEIYRLFTASFFGNSILSVIFMLMTVNYTSKTLETALGSLKFALLTFTFTLSISMLFCMTCVTIAYNPILYHNRSAMLWSYNGIWSVVVAFSVVECRLSNTPTKKLFMLPFNIPTKYYPIALTALLSFFGFNLSLPIGLIIGHLVPTNIVAIQTLQRLETESAGLLGYLIVSRPGYIDVANARGEQAYAVVEGDNITSDTNTRGHGNGLENGTGGSTGGGVGQVLGRMESAGEVPSAIDDLLPRDDPGEAAALAAERRRQRQQRNV